MTMAPNQAQGFGPWKTFVVAASGPLWRFRSVHVAPWMSSSAVTKALRGYLQLRPDELLVAVVNSPSGQSARDGCVLTTRRIYWSGPPEEREEGRPESKIPEGDPFLPRGRSAEYVDLPETIGPIDA